MKKCTVCLEFKSLDEFYKDKRATKSYPMAYCKLCSAEKSRIWRQANRARHNEISKFHSIKKKYGLDKETYLAMTLAGCEICGSFDALAVDHDHSCCPGTTTCGICVRGLLCKRHNWAAGNLKDSADEARKLADYLDRTRRLY